MFLWFVIFLLFIFYLYFSGTRHKNSPPGPNPWPIVGNLPQLATASPNPVLAVAHFSKKYREIFSLRIGLKETVVVSTKESIETVLSHDAALGRDLSGGFKDRCFGGKNLGVAMSEGEFWEKARPWTFKILRDFGFSKTNAMEHYVQEVQKKLFNQIDTEMTSMKKGEGIHMDMFFSPSIFSIMWQIIMCSLTPEDEKNIKLITDTSEKFIRSGFFGVGLANAYPILRHLLPNWTGQNAQLEFYAACNKISKEVLKEGVKIMEQSEGQRQPANFAEAFAEKMIQERGNKDTIFFEENFLLTIQDVLLGSTETTSSFMEALMLFLVRHPDVQEKLHREILEIAPDGRIIEFADYKRMPYTRAMITETHRHAKTLQNFIPRKAMRDFSYKDYLIKKGTVLLPDLHSVYTNEELWENPMEFLPERFLNAKGEFVPSNNFISFGVGRRNCPGELYATAFSFLFLTATVQKYILMVPEGQERPRGDMRVGMSSKPYPFQIVFKRR